MSLVALRLSSQTFCQVMSGIKPGSIYNRLFTSNSLHLVFIIKWPECANSGKTGWLCFESFNNCVEFCFFSSIFWGHVSTLEHYIYVYNRHLWICRMIIDKSSCTTLSLVQSNLWFHSFSVKPHGIKGVLIIFNYSVYRCKIPSWHVLRIWRFRLLYSY